MSGGDDAPDRPAPAEVRLPFAFADGTGVLRTWRRSDRASLLRHADNANVARFLSTRFPHPYTGRDAVHHHLMTHDPQAIAPTEAALGGG